MSLHGDLVVEPPAEDGLMAELAALSAETAPRRFTLCVLHPQRDDAVVVGWGMAFADELIVYLPGDDAGGGKHRLLRLSPNSRVWRRWFRTEDVRIIWIDRDSDS